MKLRSREINIFSMSALDLFASAMGAFMLLGIMSLPFFPNTGDSPKVAAEIFERLDDISDQLAEAEVGLADAEAEIEDLEGENGGLNEELARIKIPDLDIVICLDVSGSMRDRIEQLKLQIVDVANVLDRLAPSAGIGIVAFGDRNYATPITEQNIIPTSNLPAIQNFVNSLEAEQGRGGRDNPDLPEALGTALERAIAMNWRAVSARRFIIIITDAPAYPEEINSTYANARIFSSSSSPEQYVSTVMVESTQARNFLVQLADNGQGEFIDSTSGQSMLASIIMAIVNI